MRKRITRTRTATSVHRTSVEQNLRWTQARTSSCEKSAVINHYRHAPDEKDEPNEKCPCGSGKKHKKCCMIANQLATTTVAAAAASSSSPTAILDEVMDVLSSTTTTPAAAAAFASDTAWLLIDSQFESIGNSRLRQWSPGLFHGSRFCELYLCGLSVDGPQGIVPWMWHHFSERAYGGMSRGRNVLQFWLLVDTQRALPTRRRIINNRGIDNKPRGGTQ